MKTISIFDPSIASYNIGNEIITQSVIVYLRKIFRNDFLLRIPTFDIGKTSLTYLKNSDYIFFAGTNIMTDTMEKFKQWDISLKNIYHIRNVILMGVGWWQYQNSKSSLYSRLLFRSVLSKAYLHAVRDDYTLNKLRTMGINNAIVTGCPSMWSLEKSFCTSRSGPRSDVVVTSFTDYNQNILRDERMLKIIKKYYKNIFVWLQGTGDYKYAKVFGLSKFISPSIESLELFIKNNKNVDFIGTRLHAGIKFLQYQKRTIIIGVDNRAIEMKKSFGIPVETDINRLDDLIKGRIVYSIKIPVNSINKWMSQFI